MDEGKNIPAYHETEDQVLEVASLAGRIMLENGAEISRVEETMEIISSHYGVDSGNFFVLSNGIFTTGKSGFANVEFIPLRGARLEKVADTYAVLRDIYYGRLSLKSAKEKLIDIRNKTDKPSWEQIIGSGIGSAGFCIIFGGGLSDAAAALVTGLFLWTFICLVSRINLSKVLLNITGGLLGTGLCMLFHRVGFGCSLGNMIVGSLIPLIPGVAFINGIRDIADEDYIAGLTRLADAVMVFFYISAGVAFAFIGYHLICGDMLFVNGAEPDTFTASFGIQVAAAFAGTLGFSILFGLPRRNYISASFIATIGWMLYVLLVRNTSMGVVGATFFTTILVTTLSRIFAKGFKIPKLIFLIPGVFPVIPGGGIFWTTFFLVSKRMDMALQSGILALGCTAAIVLGIVIVSAIPRKRKKSRKKI